MQPLPLAWSTAGTIKRGLARLLVHTAVPASRLWLGWRPVPSVSPSVARREGCQTARRRTFYCTNALDLHEGSMICMEGVGRSARRTLRVARWRCQSDRSGVGCKQNSPPFRSCFWCVAGLRFMLCGWLVCWRFWFCLFVFVSLVEPYGCVRKAFIKHSLGTLLFVRLVSVPDLWACVSANRRKLVAATGFKPPKQCGP